MAPSKKFFKEKSYFQLINQFFLYGIIVCELIFVETKQQRSFVVDYQKNTFLKDDKPFNYVSGSIFYFRHLEGDWADIMHKARLGGLNTIQSYIEWASHEPYSEVYDFSGHLNISKFFQVAQAEGLNVVLRLGPFIASERDNMGLPWWLPINHTDIKYRVWNKPFITYVSRWYDRLLPMIVPHLYENGGPIIMVAVENEYGSFGSIDEQYKIWLRDLFRKYLGPKVILFTVDGNGQGYLKGGRIDQVLPTVDFGPSAIRTKTPESFYFGTLRLFLPQGPLVNSEFYPAWFDVWGSPHNTGDIDWVEETLDELLSINASVNFYPYSGGTSFGFMNGAFWGGSMVTSYDYDAPIGEEGRLTKSYYRIRKIIEKHFHDIPPLPNHLKQKTYLEQIKNRPTINIPVIISHWKNIFTMIETMKPIKSEWPQTFEQLNLRHGFVYYQTQVPMVVGDPTVLKINGNLYDRAYIYINRQHRATLNRWDNVLTVSLTDIEKNDTLGILVENQGHDCCGSYGIPQFKGIVGNVTLNKIILKHWESYLLFQNWSSIVDLIAQSDRITSPKSAPASDCGCPKRSTDYTPSFYVGLFNLSSSIQDTGPLYLDVRGCGRKGVAFLNDFNLGRYWPIEGPQVTLYAPKQLFRLNGINTLILFELERNSLDCMQVKFSNHYILNGTTPQNNNDDETGNDFKLFDMSD